MKLGSILCFWVLIAGTIVETRAETGMCLVVDQGKSGYDLHGKIYRIDFKDEKIVKTTGALADDAYCPRFSPDGSQFAYTKGDNTVFICNLDGVVQKQFPCDGRWLSWTSGGIWIHRNASDKFVLHNPTTGAIVRQVNIGGLSIGQAYVSQNDKTIGIRPENARCVHLDDNNRVVVIGSGCSVGPSPDGQLLTWNLGGHLTMRIVDRTGKEIRFFRIEEILAGYSSSQHSWNRQLWSGNSNDVFIIPAGKMGSGTYQQYGSTVPWIYNLRTNKAYCLHANKYADVFWFPYDYYAGKIPETTAPVAASIVITPATATVLPGGRITFSAKVHDQYGAVMASQPSSFTWSVSGGGTIAGGTFTAGQTMGGPHTVTARASGVSGTATVSVSTVLLRVNCGTNGTGYDVPGWERDDAYLVPGKEGGDYNWALPISTEGVVNAAPANVYKSVVHRDHSYHFKNIPAGTYTLRLHFADVNASSDRRMKYVANGVTVLSNFNIVREAGTGKALVKDVIVTADGNGLRLDCLKDTGNDVFECGIEILKTGKEDQAPVLELLSPRGGETFRVGDTMTIRWQGTKSSLTAVDFFFSSDYGLNWHMINDKSIPVSAATWGTYKWKIGPIQTATGTVPVVTTTAMIKVEDYDRPYMDESEPFGIAQNLSTNSVRPVEPRSPARKGGIDLPEATVYRVEWYGIDGRLIRTERVRGPAHYPVSRAQATGVHLIGTTAKGHRTLYRVVKAAGL